MRETDTMYPPLPQDAQLGELGRQLQPPAPPEPERAPAPRVGVWWRVGLLTLGIVLLVVGVAGLVLPGIQGILTIVLGVALLSMVSTTADRFLRWSLSPWPRLLEKVERRRDRTRSWLHHRSRSDT